MRQQISEVSRLLIVRYNITPVAGMKICAHFGKFVSFLVADASLSLRLIADSAEVAMSFGFDDTRNAILKIETASRGNVLPRACKRVASIKTITKRSIILINNFLTIPNVDSHVGHLTESVEGRILGHQRRLREGPGNAPEDT